MPRKKKATRKSEERNEFGSIRRLNSGRWQVRVTPPDQSRFSLGTFPDEQAAEQALQEWQVDYRRGAWRDRTRGDRTVSAMMDALIETKSDAKPSGLKDIRDAKRNLIDRTTKSGEYVGIGRVKVGDLSQMQVQQWLTRLSRDGLGLPRRRKALGYLSQVMDLAEADGRRDQGSNPCRFVRVTNNRGALRAAAHKAKFFAKPEEIVALTEAVPKARRLMVETLLWSGMRHGEVRAAAPEQVYDDRPFIYVTHTMSEGEKDGQRGMFREATKSSQSRPVALPRPLWQRLRAYIDAHEIPSGTPMWPTSRGAWMWPTPLMKYVWNPAVDKAAQGTPALKGNPRDIAPGRRRRMLPHDCRGTHASMLAMAGIERVEVQSQIGHTTFGEVTNLYTVISAEAPQDPIYDKVRGRGLSLPDTIDELYSLTWAEYGPDGGRDAVVDW